MREHRCAFFLLAAHFIFVFGCSASILLLLSLLSSSPTAVEGAAFNLGVTDHTTPELLHLPSVSSSRVIPAVASAAPAPPAAAAGAEKEPYIYRPRMEMAWRATGHSHLDLLNNLRQEGILKTNRIFDVMSKVDRKKYVKDFPYQDSPQPIGWGATISAPHMHAAALEYLSDQLQPGNSALDVGSGTGYLTTCMARLCGLVDDKNEVHHDLGKVVGIDYVKPLVEMSVDNVKNDLPKLMEAPNFKLLVGDGWKGYAEFAPYHAIHVGAAARVVPQALVDQLAVGGKMIIPLGPSGGAQYLTEVTKDESGHVKQRQLFGVRYVPLVEDTSGGGRWRF
ncbi:unnamed protein product [Vitrella brassicaformis CCMP3155]|uniref:protein-L-isoaspartate(D-aspartate) O-methyltransferase n=2 Tax=Vitrella brassicaformis TaxID=1169539 RepID=A0A0G4FUA1_VITBC|nr:unnamed protein product [Vitrella brassicaformis CCMP3155]|eukprot:CEM18497.1 unnamed protein product [Vitrella brassicaformis CCMP3155]